MSEAAQVTQRELEILRVIRERERRLAHGSLPVKGNMTWRMARRLEDKGLVKRRSGRGVKKT